MPAPERPAREKVTHGAPNVRTDTHATAHEVTENEPVHNITTAAPVEAPAARLERVAAGLIATAWLMRDFAKLTARALPVDDDGLAAWIGELETLTARVLPESDAA